VPPAQVLAEYGVDLGVCDADGCTALHLAAACGRAEAACLLLSLPGADVRARAFPRAAVTAADCSLLCDRPCEQAMHKRGENMKRGANHCGMTCCISL
jgi:ankyrin repeat protein